MRPPVFKTATADPNVKAALQAAPADEVRLYAWGEAPQGVAKPYAVWQIIGGSPGNLLDCRPQHDQYSVQFDVYADTSESALDVAEYLRDALEKRCYVTSWRQHGRDSDTTLFRVGFDVSWIVKRPPYGLVPGFDMRPPGYGVYRRQFDIAMNERWASA